MKDKIPEEFYRADKKHPVAHTVEELIEQLERLPPELPIQCCITSGAMLVVCNVNSGYPVLDIDEIDEEE